VVHARLGIAGGQQFVRTPVAIDTVGGASVSPAHGFAMEAAIIGGLLICVAARASNLLGSRLVSCALYITVAINAREYAAVDGVLEGLRIDVEANRLTVFIVSQRGVAVACQALLRSWFSRSRLAGRPKRARAQQKGEGNSRRKEIPSCSRGHALTRQCFRIELSLAALRPLLSPITFPTLECRRLGP
jgi:hypothetical protein